MASKKVEMYAKKRYELDEIKNKIKEEIERYSIIRAVTAVERADVVIIVIDAIEGVTEQDLSLIHI